MAAKSSQSNANIIEPTLGLLLGFALGTVAVLAPVHVLVIVALLIAITFSFWRPRLAILTWVFSCVLTTPVDLPLPKPLSDIRLGEYFLLMLAAVIMAKSLVSRVSFRRTFLDFPLLALIAVAVVGTSFNLLRLEATVNRATLLFNAGGLLLIVLYALAYWLVNCNVDSWADIEALYGILVSSGIVVALIGVTNFLPHASKGLQLGQRAVSTIQAGFFGNFLLLSISLVTAHIFYAQKYRTKIGLVLAWAILVAGLITSVSRSAWIGAGLSIATITFLRSRRYFGGLCFASVLILSIFPNVLSALVWFYLPSAFNYALSRLPLWRDALAIWQAHPFLGIGLGNYPLVGRVWQRGYLVTSAHNNYLQVAVEMGLIGLAVMLWLLLSSLRESWASYRRSQLCIEKALTLGTFGALIGLMSSMMFGDFFLSSVTNLGFDTFNSTVYVWILLAVMAAMRKLRMAEMYGSCNTDKE